jgi:DNA (cytosine-5)-methyltransferase 1
MNRGGSLSKNTSSGLRSHRPLAAVDLFCGVGGLTHGLARAGVPVAAGVDLDPICQYPFETNNQAKFINRDVADLQANDLLELFPPVGARILVGCAPCQSFSRYSRSSRRVTTQKWELLNHFSRLVQAVQPDVVSMENVPELRQDPLFEQFVGQLRAKGYDVTHSVVSCSDYGVPQRRSRLVLLASLAGPISLGPPIHRAERHRTVRQAISHLPKLEAGGRNRRDPLHRASNLTNINRERIQHSKAGGCWSDWPAHLVSRCHRASSGKTYPSVYGRMEWDKPAPTITTQFFGYGNGRFGHPSQDRAISLREGATLQSFPDDYQFLPPSVEWSFATLGRLIGNAVPVGLGEAIGAAIRQHLEVRGS